MGCPKVPFVYKEDKRVHAKLKYKKRKGRKPKQNEDCVII
jgi:hypothetical protein